MPRFFLVHVSIIQVIPSLRNAITFSIRFENRDRNFETNVLS